MLTSRTLFLPERKIWRMRSNVDLEIEWQLLQLPRALCQHLQRAYELKINSAAEPLKWPSCVLGSRGTAVTAVAAELWVTSGQPLVVRHLDKVLEMTSLNPSKPLPGRVQDAGRAKCTCLVQSELHNSMQAGLSIYSWLAYLPYPTMNVTCLCCST